MKQATERVVDTDLGALAAVLLAATLLLMPFRWGVLLWSPAVDQPDQVIAVHLFDLPLLALVAVAVYRHFRSGWSSALHPYPFVRVLAGAFLLWAIAATTINPSWLGVEWFTYVAAAAATAHTVVRANREELQLVLMVFSATAAIQGALGVAQSLNGGPLGLSAFEYTDPLIRFGGQYAGRGSFGHPYQLAVLLMAGIGALCCLQILGPLHARKWYRFGAFILAGLVPFSFSRGALVGLLPLVVVAAFSTLRSLRWTAAVMTIGVVIGAASTTLGPLGVDDSNSGSGAGAAPSGWVTKVERSTDADRVDNGRIELVSEAFDRLQEHPQSGVGVGRYVVHGTETGTTTNYPHNVVAHAAAETGVPGLVLAAMLLIAHAWRAFRGGSLPIMVWFTVIPFFLLDHFPYLSPVGLVISGFWVGMIVIGQRLMDQAPSDSSEAKVSRERTLPVG